MDYPQKKKKKTDNLTNIDTTRKKKKEKWVHDVKNHYFIFSYLACSGVGTESNQHQTHKPEPRDSTHNQKRFMPCY